MGSPRIRLELQKHHSTATPASNYPQIEAHGRYLPRLRFYANLPTSRLAKLQLHS